MLGDKIGEVEGQIVGMRVLAEQRGGSPVVETSFQGTGRILGHDTQELGTYIGHQRPDGSFLGEGRGATMLANGQGASWTAGGVGSVDETGTWQWRGAVYFETQAEELAPLNTVAAVYEYHQAPDGKMGYTLWEWK